MKNFLTKKNVTFTSIIFAAILLIWGSLGNIKLCEIGTIGHWFFVTTLNLGCVDSLWNIGILLLPIFPLALFSIITYKMREEVFITWINFAKRWVPLSIFLTLIAPANDGSLLPVNRGSIAFLMTALFTVLSFFIIVTKWAHKEKK